MKSRRAWLAGLAGWCGAVAASPSRSPQQEAARAVGGPEAPTRSSARAFAIAMDGVEGGSREAQIERELLSGNVPPFLRQFIAVSYRADDTEGRSHRVELQVLPDVLAIGSDDEFLRLPMALPTALRVATALGCTLPTRRIVDAIYAAAPRHLSPQPLPADDTMRSTATYWRHNAIVQAQCAAFGAAQGQLVAGHKKDLVLTERLRQQPGRVAIYGWHRAPGRPIQPLSLWHGQGYADYSHGVRLVASTLQVDGEPHALFDVLSDPQWWPLLSDEGPLPRGRELIDDILGGRG